MKRRSLETYRDIAQLHLLPAFGGKKLRDLTRDQVQRLYTQKRDAGLSASRVRRIHSVLSSALNHAVRWGLIDHNVCRKVSPPRALAPEIRPFNAEEAKRFLAAAQNDRFHALYVLGLTTGARSGDLEGLYWSDMDLDQRVVRVQRALITGCRGQTFEPPKKGGSQANEGRARRSEAVLSAYQLARLRPRSGDRSREPDSSPEGATQTRPSDTLARLESTLIRASERRSEFDYVSARLVPRNDLL